MLNNESSHMFMWSMQQAEAYQMQHSELEL